MACLFRIKKGEFRVFLCLREYFRNQELLEEGENRKCLSRNCLDEPNREQKWREKERENGETTMCDEVWCKFSSSSLSPFSTNVWKMSLSLLPIFSLNTNEGKKVFFSRGLIRSGYFSFAAFFECFFFSSLQKLLLLLRLLFSSSRFFVVFYKILTEKLFFLKKTEKERLSFQDVIFIFCASPPSSPLRFFSVFRSSFCFFLLLQRKLNFKRVWEFNFDITTNNSRNSFSFSFFYFSFLSPFLLIFFRNFFFLFFFVFLCFALFYLFFCLFVDVLPRELQWTEIDNFYEMEFKRERTWERFKIVKDWR